MTLSPQLSALSFQLYSFDERLHIKRTRAFMIAKLTAES